VNFDIINSEQRIAGQKGNLMARKRYQTGSLFQSGKKIKVWKARWREDVIEDGILKRRLKNEVIGTLSQFPTRRLAQRELDNRLAHINCLAYKPTHSLTLQQLYLRWREHVLCQHKKSSQSTINKNINKHLLPLFGDMPLSDISTEMLQSSVVKWHVSPTTVRTIVAIFQMLWRSAKSWGYVKHDPFDGLILPRLQKKERRSFTVDEMRRIIEAAQEPFKTFYWLAAETGLRAGELCGLRLCDVDWQRNVIQVRQRVWHKQVDTPKTSTANRVMAISPELAERLQHIAANRNAESLLFIGPKGAAWDQTYMCRYYLQPLLERLGILKAGFHAFRHASGTLMDEMNLPLKTRQSRLGHADPSTTIGIYTHRIDAADREFSKNITRILFRNVPAFVEGTLGSA